MKGLNRNKKFTVLLLILCITFSISLNSSTSSDGKLLTKNGTDGSNPPSNPKSLSDGFSQDISVKTLFNNSKLSFIYVGALYCPYCAMEQWAIVMALSNFGTFSGLSTFTTAEDNVPAYNLTSSTYTSSKVDFEPVEIYNNNNPPNQQLYQNLTTFQNTLYTKYGHNTIPFLCLGGSVFRSGAGDSLNINSFSGVSFSTIQSQVNSKSGTLYNEIVTESQYLVDLINQLYNHPVTTISSGTPSLSGPSISNNVIETTSLPSFESIELITSFVVLIALFKQIKTRNS